jgi:hypothetical protein
MLQQVAGWRIATSCKLPTTLSSEIEDGGQLDCRELAAACPWEGMGT